ncbi:MAG: GTPase HflX, partial [Neisseriaceae bacterium]|nr:GTPase HflX [Neisseriaceae bacterium]
MKPAFQIDNTQTRTEKILLVCVDFPHIPDFNIAVAEAVELVKAVDGELRQTVVCKRNQPHSALFVGTGKVDELAEIVAINQIDLVIFNHELSPTQERNLEKVLHCRVLDRVGLILAIFAQRAQTPEAKLQVETAQLTHLSARLIRGYGHLQSQRGGIGLKGPGETQLELDRRLIGQKIVRLNKRLAEVKKNRAVQRQNRRRNKMPVFALVGYTNVGKSTLFNALTKSEVLVKNQLFATLDTTARRLWLSPECNIILTDTVGFVRDLPHSLIYAFSATLEETANADILLHIVDISDKN